MPQHVFFLSTPSIERWTYSNPDAKGIGGSETSHIELSWRLAKRGYDVTSFVPGQEQCDEVWRNVLWQNWTKADYSAHGVWFIYRDPKILDKFSLEHPGQTLIFVAQDVEYPDASVARYSKLDKFMCLCEDHATYTVGNWPILADKVVISSNGLKPELVDKALAMGIERNPKRLMYASSPDRGLKNLAAVFKRAKEYVPDLELHTYYGFDNMDTIRARSGRHAAYISAKAKDSILSQVEGVPGIYMHGRVNQETLYKEWCKSGLMVAPTSFTETGFITEMEAMALGAIPITNPIWAAKDHTKYGVLIEGNPDHDLLIRGRYIGEILRLTSDAGIELQEQIRKEMMPWAKATFSWENYVNQLEEWIKWHRYRQPVEAPEEVTA
jgi:glycosyltransferase involved in cell wall biosynthesis